MELRDQAEMIYAGTTMVNSQEANIISSEVTLTGYSHAAAAPDKGAARAAALNMIYTEADQLYHGIRFRRKGSKQVQWLPPERGQWVPSSLLRVLDLGRRPGTDLYRVQAVAKLPADFQKALVLLPPVVAVGNADVPEGSDIFKAWTKARDAALVEGVERAVWYQYSSKVPPDLAGTLYVEKYFRDPLVGLLPGAGVPDSLQLLLKLRIRLDNPIT